MTNSYIKGINIPEPVEERDSLEHLGIYGTIGIFFTIIFLGAINSHYNLNNEDSFHESLRTGMNVLSNALYNMFSKLYDLGQSRPSTFIVLSILILIVWTGYPIYRGMRNLFYSKEEVKG